MEKPPGIEFPRGTPYGLGEHFRSYGNGDNMLRTERMAQPRALQTGDRLATGERVLSPSREGGNGSVFIHLEREGHSDWISVPARIPLALG
jgi:hypothetical protein